jgi:hypothetical protein
VVLPSPSPEIVEEIVEEGLPGDEALDQVLPRQEVWVVERHTTCLIQ